MKRGAKLMSEREVDSRTSARLGRQPTSLPFKSVFVVGCPRSGTTWVQLLLQQHPDVVTAPETQVFAFYLDRLRRQWSQEHGGPGAEHQGRAGLCRLLSDEEFDDLCRTVAKLVLLKIFERDPSVSTVVEKSPKHALFVSWIHRLFPHAFFLHVIRDPRDAVASMLAAGETWGAGWAPKSVVDASRRWCANVESAMEGRDLGDRYLEVRFEDLKEDAAGQLSRIHGWLDLETDRAMCDAAAEACSLSRLKKADPSDDVPLPGERSPEDFFRKGESGSWRSDLTGSQARVVEHLCGALMETLGYQGVMTERSTTRFRVLLHDGVRRIREALDWQLERLQRRL